MLMAGDKEWKKLKDEEKISYCNKLLEDVRQSREKRDVEWYLNHRFVRGEHYLSFNTVTNSIESNPPRRRGEVRMVVNKIRASKRAIQNYIISSRPKWETVPGDTDPDTLRNARISGKFLDYLFRRLHLEQMVSGAVDTALDKSIAWVELDWDESAEKGMGQIRVRLQDPFNVWLDKRAYLYGGKVKGQFMAKTLSKSLAEIKVDARYNEKNRKKVKEEETPAVSRMHAKIIRKETGADNKVIPRAIVKEFMLWEEDVNEKGGYIHLFTYAGDKVLVDEPTENIDYPIYPLQISMNPLVIYQRAWTSDAVPLNKALDRSLSQKIMYVNQALRYAIIAEKGHGAGVVSNEMGEIIEINKGRSFQQLAIQPLPSGYEALNIELNRYIEDILGAHDAAMGRMPAGARSGKTLEALQAADSNNLTGIIQSLESFLSVLGEQILEIVSEKYVASRIIKLTEPEEGEEFMRVSGEGGTKREDAAIITGDNEVIVKIGSWLGHTREAKIDNLLRLAELGVIPGEEVLKQLEFPNIEELSAKAKEQRLEQHQLDAEIAGRNQGGGQGQGRGGNQEAGIDMMALADKENMAMANGEVLPPTEGATPDHSQGHRDFMLSKTFKQLSPEIQKVFMDHYNGEVGY